MNPNLKPYFFIAKEAFEAHQYAPGATTAQPTSGDESNNSLEQTFEYHGVPIFAFDLRSNRNIHNNRAMRNEQMKSFQEWCRGIEDDREY